MDGGYQQCMSVIVAIVVLSVSFYGTRILSTLETTALTVAQRWIWSERMNENKYYLKIDNRTIAERVSLEHALIFIKSIFENYYNDHEIVISIAEMRRYEDDEVNK